MAKIDIDKLLKPVSESNPCGPEKDDDMTLYADWSVIEKHAQGQAEDQFGRGKEPDWKSVFSGSQELLAKTKDAEVATYLLAATVKLHGLSGFGEGIQFLVQFVEKYWGEMYPQPDGRDFDLILERIEAISIDPLEFPDDTLNVAKNVQLASVGELKGYGPISSDAIVKAKKNEGDFNTDSIKSALADIDPSELEKSASILEKAATDLKQLEVFVKEKTGDTYRPDLHYIVDRVSKMKTELDSSQASEPAVPQQSSAAAGGQTASSSGAAPMSSSVGSVVDSGAIQSRTDVVASLNAIVEYYRQCEPGSPIPFLLKRSIELVDKDFIEIIKNFRSDLDREFKSILGVSDGGKGGDVPRTNPAPAAKAVPQDPPPSSKPPGAGRLDGF